MWNGTISFGLVSLPISLYPAIRKEELQFRLLGRSDLSPVNYKRVAEADGKEVPWNEIVKGYEYEKGKFVVLKDEDFKRVDIEATQSVDIINFVALEEVDPLLFYKPYYVEVDKGGSKAYVLLREALRSSGKVAISKLVIKTRQHLAAVKAQKKGLILELMHFPAELLDPSEFKSPPEQTLGKPERNMASQLIKSMASSSLPEDFADDYREALARVIEEKVEHRGRRPAAVKRRRKRAPIIDLVAVLQESLKKAKAHAPATAKSSPRRKAA